MKLKNIFRVSLFLLPLSFQAANQLPQQIPSLSSPLASQQPTQQDMADLNLSEEDLMAIVPQLVKATYELKNASPEYKKSMAEAFNISEQEIESAIDEMIKDMHVFLKEFGEQTGMDVNKLVQEAEEASLQEEMPALREDIKEAPLKPAVNKVKKDLENLAATLSTLLQKSNHPFILPALQSYKYSIEILLYYIKIIASSKYYVHLEEEKYKETYVLLLSLQDEISTLVHSLPTPEFTIEEPYSKYGLSMHASNQEVEKTYASLKEKFEKEINEIHASSLSKEQKEKRGKLAKEKKELFEDDFEILRNKKEKEILDKKIEKEIQNLSKQNTKMNKDLNEIIRSLKKFIETNKLNEKVEIFIKEYLPKELEESKQREALKQKRAQEEANIRSQKPSNASMLTENIHNKDSNSSYGSPSSSAAPYTANPSNQEAPASDHKEEKQGENKKAGAGVSGHNSADRKGNIKDGRIGQFAKKTSDRKEGPNEEKGEEENTETLNPYYQKIFAGISDLQNEISKESDIKNTNKKYNSTQDFADTINIKIKEIQKNLIKAVEEKKKPAYKFFEKIAQALEICDADLQRYIDNQPEGKRAGAKADMRKNRDNIKELKNAIEVESPLYPCNIMKKIDMELENIINNEKEKTKTKAIQTKETIEKAEKELKGAQATVELATTENELEEADLQRLERAKKEYEKAKEEYSKKEKISAEEEVIIQKELKEIESSIRKSKEKAKEKIELLTARTPEMEKCTIKDTLEIKKEIEKKLQELKKIDREEYTDYETKIKQALNKIEEENKAKEIQTEKQPKK